MPFRNYLLFRSRSFLVVKLTFSFSTTPHTVGDDQILEPPSAQPTLYYQPIRISSSMNQLNVAGLAADGDIDALCIRRGRQVACWPRRGGSGKSLAPHGLNLFQIQNWSLRCWLWRLGDDDGGGVHCYLFFRIVNRETAHRHIRSSDQMFVVAAQHEKLLN